MHASRREKTLTEYISARVTQREGERIRECAGAAGLTRSEWCRQAVLSAIDTPAQTQAFAARISRIANARPGLSMRKS